MSLDFSLDNSIIIVDKAKVDVQQFIDSYYDASYFNHRGLYAANTTECAQSFTASGTYEIDSLRVRMCKFGSPTGTAVARIYAHTGTYGTSSVPTGSVLATSGTLDVSTLSGSDSWITFEFTGSNRIILNSGTYYCISIYYNGGDASNQVWVGMKGTGAHGGNESYYSGGAWNISGSPTYDVVFYLLGLDPTLEVETEEFMSLTESDGISDSLELSVSDDIAIVDYVDVPPARIRINIDYIERTKYVQMDSLYIENVLTSEVDTCTFIVKKVVGSTRLNYNPTIGNDVTITFQHEKIFGGVITKITQRADSYGIVEFVIECCDYTRFLDRRLVADTYSGMTVNAIIASIASTYLDGFTTDNVSCSLTLDYVGFNYISVSKAFSELAELTKHDWYIDYNKDIHFFAKDSRNAPFNLEDDTNTYILESLQLKQDNSQLRNVIYVRGGEYLADTFTTEIKCDGTKTIYEIPYKYQGLSVTTSAEGGAGTGRPLTVGLDDIDSADLYDVLWNYQEKIVKFRDARKPNNGNVLRIGGRPYLPVRIKTSNRASVEEMKTTEGGTGEYEYVVIDASIKTKTAALERADAELESYQNTLVEGEFSTHKDGLRAGQQILINSTMHEVNDTYLINRVITRIVANDLMKYDVSVVTTKTYGIIEFLQDLLISENKRLSEQGENVETVDVVESVDESFSLSDTFTASVNHNHQYETITLNEVKTEHILDWNVEFVLGLYVPSDVSTDIKRQFTLDGSILQGTGLSVSDDISISESLSITKT